MINLFDYDVLVNEVFYRCWHILEYIEKHPDMPDLEKQAIKATIMDALVTRGQIDPKSQSLDLDNFCIVNNLEHYNYEEHPNICGIPLWMKNEFRKKSITITGGIPISMFLAKPPSKTVRHCVYDPNIAVSAIFEDATFYNAIYNSPTRGIRITETRPFVEVKINDENYLVDTLTKRILKSSWFKETYNFEVKSQSTISKMDEHRLYYYKEAIREHNELSTYLSLSSCLLTFDTPEQQEKKYEIEQSKIFFKEEWNKYEEQKIEKENFFANAHSFIKRKNNS